MNTTEEQIKDILAEITDGADAKFIEVKSEVERAFIVQETERIMALHREVIGRWTRKINDLIEEVGDNPEQCLSIIGEQLNGGKEVFSNMPTKPKKVMMWNWKQIRAAIKVVYEKDAFPDSWGVQSLYQSVLASSLCKALPTPKRLRAKKKTK